jgi:hypothetical protein
MSVIEPEGPPVRYEEPPAPPVVSGRETKAVLSGPHSGYGCKECLPYLIPLMMRGSTATRRLPRSGCFRRAAGLKVLLSFRQIHVVDLDVHFGDFEARQVLDAFDHPVAYGLGQLRD